MHDKFVLGKIVEAQALPGEGFARALPSASPLLEAFRASENFRIGQQGKFGIRQREPAGQCAEHGRKRPRRNRITRGQLAQSRGFALVGANDLHRPSVLLPSADLTEQIPPALLEQNDVTGGEGPTRMRAGGNFDFAALRQHGSRMDAERRLRHGFFHGEEDGALGQMILRRAFFLGVGQTEADLAGFECFDRTLRIRIVRT